MRNLCEARGTCGGESQDNSSSVEDLVPHHLCGYDVLQCGTNEINSEKSHISKPVGTSFQESLLCGIRQDTVHPSGNGS